MSFSRNDSHTPSNKQYHFCLLESGNLNVKQGFNNFRKKRINYLVFPEIFFFRLCRSNKKDQIIYCRPQTKTQHSCLPHEWVIFVKCERNYGTPYAYLSIVNFVDFHSRMISLCICLCAVPYPRVLPNLLIHASETRL